MPTQTTIRTVSPTRHPGDVKRLGIRVEHDGRRAQSLTLATDGDDIGDGLWTVDFGLLAPDLETVQQTRTLTLDPRDAATTHNGAIAYRTIDLPGQGVPLDRLTIISESWVSPWKLWVARARESDWTPEQAVAWLRSRQGDTPRWLASRVEWLRKIRNGERAQVLNPWATPALEQFKTSTGTGVTFDAGPTEDNLMTCTRSHNSGAEGTRPTGWTSAVYIIKYGYFGGLDQKVAGASESATQTWSSEGGNKAKTAREWSGVEASSPLDQTASDDTQPDGANQDLDSGTTAALSQNDALALAGGSRFYGNFGSINSVSAGWTSGNVTYSGGSGVQVCVVDAYRAVTDGAAQACTINVGDDYGGLGFIATWAAVAGGGPAAIPASRRQVFF